MRKLTLILLAWLCLALGAISAQNQNPEAKLLDMLSPLDMADIRASTGIFIDRVPSYVPLRHFKGSAVTDSTHVTPFAYGLAYDMLSLTHLDGSTMYPSDSTDARVVKYTKAPVVHLGLMAYKYDRFKTDALTSSLVTYDGERFQDVVGANPYIRDTMVMGINHKAQFSGLTVAYYMPATFMSTNITDIASIDIDYGNGDGYQPLIYDRYTDITYDTAGVHTIVYKITLTTGQVLLSSSQITISDSSSNATGSNTSANRGGDGYGSTPDGMHIIGTSVPGTKWVKVEGGLPPYDNYYIEVPDPDNPVATSGLEIHYWFNKACMNDKIRKPLIISDGFDPGNKRGAEFVLNGADGLLDVDYQGNGKTLKDLIHDEGYDLFFINYVAGDGDIPTNALYLKQAIEWINAQKHAAGSSEKNIYVGPSMGGVIGKWMFQEFENLGQDHECELFISYDSPLRGANIPLAMQALPFRLGNREVLGEPLWKKQVALKNGIDALSSPAAKQMLYYNLALVDNNTTTVSPAMLDDWHDAFYAALDARGELEVPHIAISNGAINGAGQSFIAGALIQEMIIWPLTETDATIYARGLALSPSQTEIHMNSINITILTVPIIDPEYLTITAGFIPYDNAPGGMASFNKTGPNGEISYENGWNYASFCFIPTISALDLRNVTDPFATGLTDIDATQAASAPQIRTYIGSTSTSTQYGSVQFNQEHVSFNNQLATFLLGNIKKHELSGELTNRTFNFGKATYSASYPNGTITTTSHTIKKNLVVSNTGKLWINRNDKIAFTDQPNFANIKPSFFDVSISADCGVATTVEVKDGGQINIGEISINNIGELTIADNNRLLISSGGTVTVDDKSSITVQKDGILEIMSGSTLIVKGDGLIDIQKGSQVIVHKGAKIILEKPIPAYNAYSIINPNVGSRINLSGMLTMNGGEIALSGAGYLRFLNNHTIESTTSDIAFKGHGTAYTSYFVDAPVVINNYNLSIVDAYFYLNNELTTNGNASRSFAVNASKFDFYSDLWEVTDGNATPLSKHNLNINNIKSAIFNSTQFKDVICKINKCGFVNGSSVHAVTHTKPRLFELTDVAKATFNRSTFRSEKPIYGLWTTINTEVFKIGIDLLNVGELRLNYSDIIGFNKENGLRIPTNKAHIGISAEKSPYIFMKDSKILKCQYGIKANDAYNLTMINSEIGNCDDIGIEMNGDQAMGLVKMICSSIHDCPKGIYGADITLAIDGLINAQTGLASANAFINNKIHFSVKYEKKARPDIIYARYNKWTNPPSDVNGVAVDYSFAGLGLCDQKKPVDCAALPPKFPIIITGSSTEVYRGFCPDATTCTGFPIMEKYWRGFNCYFNDNLESGVEELLPLGLDHYSTGNDDLGKYCRAMLAEA